ncbi:MAG: DUF998 domain-containing protein [Marmoricola sp.]
MKISTRTLATVSAATTALFPAIVVVLNLVQHRNYDPIKQAISELALGSGGTAMVLAFCGLAVGIAALAAVIRTQSLKARAVPIILAVAAVLAGPLSAGFHTDRTGAPTTWHGTLHNDAGLGAFLLLLAAMLISSFAFSRDPFWKGHVIATRVLTVAAVISFFLIPVLGQDHFGLSQRLFVGSFVSWLIVSAVYASRSERRLAISASAV